jgi:DNA replication protein DnaC
MARAKKATEAPTDLLDAMLARLQLSGIRDQLDSLLDEAARANLSARETLILLCEREIARKDHRRIEMALKLAHFPAVKELAGFDFEAQPSVNPKQIRDLAASRWIANGENVLLLGPPESDSYCPSHYVPIVPVLFAADRQMPDGAVAGLVPPA